MKTPLIKILQPGDEAALEAFLRPRVESSMFLIGNLRAGGLDSGDGRYQGSYTAAFEGEQIVGVAAHYWNGNLILQAPVHLETLWLAAAQASGWAIKGAIGPAGQVETVRMALDIRPEQIQVDEWEGLYSLPLSQLNEPEALR